MLRMVMALIVVLCGLVVTQAQANLSSVQKQKVLEILKDDCANCHGFYRMGGLGPKLTPESLKKYPTEIVVAIIKQGVGGRFMPSWKKLLNDQEIRFLAHYLKTTPPDTPRFERRLFQANAR